MGWLVCLQRMQKSFVWEPNICGDIFGIVFLQGFILASADIFAPMVCREIYIEYNETLIAHTEMYKKEFEPQNAGCCFIMCYLIYGK